MGTSRTSPYVKYHCIPGTVEEKEVNGFLVGVTTTQDRNSRSWFVGTDLTTTGLPYHDHHKRGSRADEPVTLTVHYRHLF